VRRGARTGERRWPLTSLKRAEIGQADRGWATGERRLTLTFAGGKVALTSASYEGFAARRDQGAAFAAFARALLAQAADAAPGARFLRAAPPFAMGLAWTCGLLGAGAAIVAGFGALSGALALGLDLGARLTFVLLLLASLWPWLGDERRRAFDPGAPAPDLLAPN